MLVPARRAPRRKRKLHNSVVGTALGSLYPHPLVARVEVSNPSASDSVHGRRRTMGRDRRTDEDPYYGYKRKQR